MEEKDVCIAVLGSEKSGKSELIKRLIGIEKERTEKDEYKPTIYNECSKVLSSKKGGKFNVNFIEVGGTASIVLRKRCIYYRQRGVNLFIYTVRLSSYNSLTLLKENFLVEKRSFLINNAEYPFIIVGTFDSRDNDTLIVKEEKIKELLVPTGINNYFMVDIGKSLSENEKCIEKIKEKILFLSKKRLIKLKKLKRDSVFSGSFQLDKQKKGVLNMLKIASNDLDSRSFVSQSEEQQKMNKMKEFRSKAITLSYGYDLHFYCFVGDEEKVRELIPIRDLNKRWKRINNASALHLAIYTNQVNIVKMLLDNVEINPNIVTKEGFTPLLFACKNGRVEIINLLLNDTRVKIDKKDHLGNLPIRISENLSVKHALREQIKKERKFLKKVSDEKCKAEEIRKYLVENKVNVNCVSGKFKETALEFVLKRNQTTPEKEEEVLEIVEILLNNGASFEKSIVKIPESPAIKEYLLSKYDLRKRELTLLELFQTEKVFQDRMHMFLNTYFEDYISSNKKKAVQILFDSVYYLSNASKKISKELIECYAKGTGFSKHIEILKLLIKQVPTLEPFKVLLGTVERDMTKRMQFSKYRGYVLKKEDKLSTTPLYEGIGKFSVYLGLLRQRLFEYQNLMKTLIKYCKKDEDLQNYCKNAIEEIQKVLKLCNLNHKLKESENDLLQKYKKTKIKHPNNPYRKYIFSLDTHPSLDYINKEIVNFDIYCYSDLLYIGKGGNISQFKILSGDFKVIYQLDKSAIDVIVLNFQSLKEILNIKLFLREGDVHDIREKMIEFNNLKFFPFIHVEDLSVNIYRRIDRWKNMKFSKNDSKIELTGSKLEEKRIILEGLRTAHNDLYDEIQEEEEIYENLVEEKEKIENEIREKLKK